jgi:hypothetical protein
MNIIRFRRAIFSAAILAVLIYGERAEEKTERQGEATSAAVKRVEAEPGKGFHHPYLLLVPTELVANPTVVGVRSVIPLASRISRR